MPNQILMPALSPTMKEGKIAKWLKQEGDKVSSGDVLCEIETDKATMELEAVDEGVLGKIIHPAGGEMIPVNKAIAYLFDEGETIDDLKLDQTKDSAEKKAEKKSSSKEVATSPANDQALQADQLKIDQESSMQKKQTNQINESRSENKSGRVFVSPLAKRLAKQKKIDLLSVVGTGPRGRIIASDIKNYKGTKQSVADQSRFDIAVDQELVFDLIPHSMMREVIAKRLTEAKSTIPHFYLSAEFELDNLLKARADINNNLASLDSNKVKEVKSKQGDNQDKAAKISVNDLMIKASALALVDTPSANVSWSEEGLKQYKNIHISVAVATDQGLITPIIKNPDRIGLLEISSRVKDLASRARRGKLMPEEYQGGCFTISNLGMFGIKNFQAIINPPQACILAIGAGSPKLSLTESGTVVTKTVVEVTLSVDHRAVDGAIGANYLSALKKYIENPAMMLL